MLLNYKSYASHVNMQFINNLPRSNTINSWPFKHKHVIILCNMLNHLVFHSSPVLPWLDIKSCVVRTVCDVAGLSSSP